MTTTTACSTDVRHLAELELFGDADRDLLAVVAQRSIELDIPKGRELVSEGSEAREFVVIIDGFAAVTSGGRSIAHLGPGSCFGEMSLIDGRRRTATVTAASPMRVIAFTREDFMVLLTQEPSFGMRILTMVVGRLRLANAQLAERAHAGSGPPARNPAWPAPSVPV